MEEREKLLQVQTELNRANSSLLQLQQKPKSTDTKKLQDLQTETKRQHQIIEAKARLIDDQKCELAKFQGLQLKYDKANQLLKETVTRKCALEAACSAKEKRLEECQVQIQALEQR